MFTALLKCFNQHFNLTENLKTKSIRFVHTRHTKKHFAANCSLQRTTFESAVGFVTSQNVISLGTAS